MGDCDMIIRENLTLILEALGFREENLKLCFQMDVLSDIVV